MVTRRISLVRWRWMVVWLGVGVLLAAPGESWAGCDTWVAMGDVTARGWVLLGKNSDRPTFGCQPLVMHRGRTWPAGATIDLVRVKIDQAKQTYTTLGSSPYWSWGYEEGINEHSVAIGNEAVWTKVLTEEIKAAKAGNGPKLGPTGMDLVRLGLERGRTARQALEAIAAVVETYGQFGSASPTRGLDGAYHNSFIIADPREAWILETAGGHWVAKRVASGSTSISNALTLGWEHDLASKRLVSHAVAKGWWPAGQTGRFHFQHAYSNGTRADDKPVTRVHRRARASRRLLAERAAAGKIDVRWMMHVSRSPSIGLNVTASGSVAVLPNTDAQLPVYWWCPSVPTASCFVPFFVHGSGPPEIVTKAGTYGTHDERPSKTGRDRFSADSYWWLFRDLADTVRADRKARQPIVTKAFETLEKDFAAGLGEVVTRAARLRKAGQSDKARALLDAYTAACVKRAVVQVNALRKRFAAKGK